MKVNTPFATIGVRGSGGIVNVDAAGQTTLNMTQCCLDISARGSTMPPVGLVKVNTFSRVSTKGEVSVPAPAPLSMLMQLNNAVSLEGVEALPEGAGEPGIDAGAGSLKSLLGEKQEEEKPVAEDPLAALIKEESGTLESTPKQEKPLPAEKNPLKNSLLATFGSDPLLAPEGQLEPINTGEFLPSLSPQTTTASQGTLAGATINGTSSGGVAQFGTPLSGTWERRKAGNLIENGNMNAVVKDDQGLVIFEKKDNAGIVQETVAFNAPAAGRAISVNSLNFGNMFIYRGLHSNFVYSANNFNSPNDDYKFIAGRTGVVNASNQRIEGQRLFFNFIPDTQTLNQFADFNLTQGMHSPYIGSGYSGARAHAGGGLVIDYTNQNNQFVGGHVNLSSNLSQHDFSFKFMAGEMETSGAAAMDGSVYAFSSKGIAGAANTYTFKEGDLTAASSSVYGVLDPSSQNAVIDAYGISLGGSDYNESLVAVNAGTQTPVGQQLNAENAPQSLKGYSAGYLVKDVNGTPSAVMIGNNDYTKMVMIRKDETGANTGVTLQSSFTYNKIYAGNQQADILEVGFGGNSTDPEDKAYVSHNIYGAENTSNANNYDATTAYFGGSIDPANVEAAMLSSYFVDIPGGMGIQEDCRDCQFLTWGVWAGTIDIGGNEAFAQIIPYVVGDSNTMNSWTGYAAAVGTADVSYEGILVGATSNGAQVSNAVGSFDATANFSTRTVAFDGKFADFTFTGSQSGLATGGMASFPDVVLDNLEHSSALGVDIGDATISGAFYGGQAENIGGNFNFEATSGVKAGTTGAGIFAGKQP